MMNNEITVTIPYEGQPFSYDRYSSPTDCYLATALKKAGFQDVSIGGDGATSIGKEEYVPKERFNTNVVTNSFEEEKDLQVVLIKQ